jgi:hypothetical protein
MGTERLNFMLGMVIVMKGGRRWIIWGFEVGQDGDILMRLREAPYQSRGRELRVSFLNFDLRKVAEIEADTYFTRERARGMPLRAYQGMPLRAYQG